MDSRKLLLQVPDELDFGVETAHIADCPFEINPRFIVLRKDQVNVTTSATLTQAKLRQYVLLF